MSLTPYDNNFKYYRVIFYINGETKQQDFYSIDDANSFYKKEYLKNPKTHKPYLVNPDSKW